MSQENNTENPQEKAEVILIMGDVHIPNRIDRIPEEVKNVLKKSHTKLNRIICTGNYGNAETLEWFKSLLAKDCAGNFHCVKDDFQETKISFPKTACIESGEFKIGLINGYQIVPWGDLTALNAYSKQLECDILVSGFTHIKGVYQFEGKWLVNPGTITGAFSSLKNNPLPSFMILVTIGDLAVLNLYEFNPSSNAFDISKIEISKS